MEIAVCNLFWRNKKCLCSSTGLASTGGGSLVAICVGEIKCTGAPVPSRPAPAPQFAIHGGQLTGVFAPVPVWPALEIAVCTSCWRTGEWWCSSWGGLQWEQVGRDREKERERERERPPQALGRGSGADGMGAHNHGNDCDFGYDSCWSFKSGPAAEKRKKVANVLVFANDWGTRRRAIHTRHRPTAAGQAAPDSPTAWHCATSIAKHMAVANTWCEIKNAAAPAPVWLTLRIAVCN